MLYASRWAMRTWLNVAKGCICGSTRVPSLSSTMRNVWSLSASTTRWWPFQWNETLVYMVVFQYSINSYIYLTPNVSVHQVLAQLRKDYADTYTFENVILSGTHTHGTPGGFMMDLLYDMTTFGFVSETHRAIVDGIARVRTNLASILVFQNRFWFII